MASVAGEDMVTSSQTSYSFKGMQPGIYTYKVRAVDADGSVGYWSNSITVDLQNAATDINSVVVDSARPDNGYIYDLSGRRLDSVSKGIYIKNGKKILR